MCTGTPDIPTPPERQDARAPSRDPRAAAGDAMKRRRGYASMIRTATSAGDLTPVRTTGGATTMPAKNLGA